MPIIANTVYFTTKSLTYVNLHKFRNLASLLLSSIIARISKKQTGNNLPAFISVEPNNFCQLRCPECPVGQKTTKNKAFIDEKLFKKIIDELKRTLFHVIFYFQGEPLLNKKLTDLIKYAHEAKIFTSTSTNAQSLDSDMAEKLVQSGLDKLIISIDGSTQESYERYRIGGSLEKAIQGLTQVVNTKKRLHSVTPFVEIQFIVLKSNEHQIKEMKRLSKNLNADRIVFKSAQLYDFEQGHKLLTSIDKYARYKKDPKTGKYQIKSKLKNHCWRQWSGAVINSDGNLLPCCFDKDGKHAFGNLKDDSFMSVWHNKKASDFRASILQNRKQFEMCRNCTSK